MSAQRESANGASPMADLMRAMGSKNGSWDPIPPDNYLEPLDNSDNPEEIVIAYVRSKTLRSKHRSPWMVDDRGNELYLSNLAADCRWALPHASVYVNRVVDRGVIRTERVGQNLRIGLCADVPKRKSKTNVKQLPVTRNCPTYVLQQVERLSPDLQTLWTKGEGELNELEREALAVSTSAVREAVEVKRLQFYASFGIEVKKRPDVKQKAAEEKAGRPVRVAVQVSLFDFSVQVTVDPAQVTVPTCTDTPESSVQESAARPSFKNRNIDVDNYISPSSSSLPMEPEPTTTTVSDSLLEIAAALASDEDAARDLLAACQANDPANTAAEIVDHIGMKRAQLKGKRVENMTGLLLHAVPKMMTAAKMVTYREERRADAAQLAAQNRRIEERLEELRRQEAEYEKANGAGG